MFPKLNNNRYGYAFSQYSFEYKICKKYLPVKRKKTNKTIFTHFSLSKKEASENKLWYPLVNNKAWTYSGKTYFYENISNNIYEIVINSDNRFSLNKRFTINMSPLSVDYPQTSRMNQEDYKAGTALHLSDIKSGLSTLF